MLPSRIELRWLVASHVLLAMVPSAAPFLPPDIRFLPLLWALSSISLGQMLLLSFWVGMGTGRVIGRLSIALIGCVYIAVWPTLGSAVCRTIYHTQGFSREFGAAVAMNSMMVLAFASVFLLVRRWFSELRWVPDTIAGRSRTRMQYSILNILVLTAVVALLLGLLQGARPADATVWPLVAAYALALVVFLINTLCSVWAALSPGRVRWRVTLVFLIASLLSVLMSVSQRLSSVAWWLVPGWMLVSIMPVALVIASLAVVRGCGYRLISKVPEQVPNRQTGDGNRRERE